MARRLGGTREHHESRATGLSNSTVTLAGRAATQMSKGNCDKAFGLLSEAREISGMARSHFTESDHGPSSVRRSVIYAQDYLAQVSQNFKQKCVIK